MYYILKTIDTNLYGAITDSLWLHVDDNDTNWYDTLTELNEAIQQNGFTAIDDDDSPIRIQDYSDMRQYVADIDADPAFINVQIIHETDDIDTLLDQLPEYLI